MSFPLFKFTLNNTVAGPQVISEPGGWDTAKLKLERNEEYHSLVEYYDQALLFYGSSNDGNGGLEYIKSVESTQGPDAQINILIEISENSGLTYSTLYTGLLDITSIKEHDFYTLECGIIRDDFWQRFINRKATPVDVSNGTSMDGVPIVFAGSYTLNLPSQKVHQKYEMIPDDSTTGPFNSDDSTSTATTQYLLFDNTNVKYDEILDRYSYGTQISDLLPTDFSKFIYQAAFDGDYTINSTIAYSLVFSASKTYDVRWFLAYRSGGVLTTTQIGSTNSGTGTTVSSFGVNPVLSTTINLIAGDEIYIYGKVVINTTAASITYFANDNVNGVYTSLSLVADTIYILTQTDAFTIFTAGSRIIANITNISSALSSNFLNNASACGNYAIMKGLNIRGYLMSAKPLSMSFDDWWNGVNPILNLGLGYVSGSNVLEVLHKSDFYDPTTSVNLSFVNLIERSYNEKLIFKSIDVGYEKWSAESDAGVDDPQSKRTFRTRFSTVGDDYKIESKFIAASLAIEQTRRNRMEAGKDWRLDDDIFIIALDKTNITNPELSVPFTFVSGLLNYTTRYNIRLSATRNFKRWLSYLNGCLKWYSTNDDFTFQAGEGNFDMTSTLDVSDCEGDGINLNEKGNLDGGADQPYNFVPIQYDFEHPLTHAQYSTILANRKKAIGISRGNSGFVSCFIMNLEYEVTHGKGKFTVLLGQSTPL